MSIGSVSYVLGPPSRMLFETPWGLVEIAASLPWKQWRWLVFRNGIRIADILVRRRMSQSIEITNGEGGKLVLKAHHHLRTGAKYYRSEGDLESVLIWPEFSDSQSESRQKAWRIWLDSRLVNQENLCVALTSFIVYWKLIMAKRRGAWRFLVLDDIL